MSTPHEKKERAGAPDVDRTHEMSRTKYQMIANDLRGGHTVVRQQLKNWEFGIICLNNFLACLYTRMANHHII